ncbi:hypothetical protein ACFYM2_09825 [Streptomyces sp. NPDC006711]|uniref:hypothetical protein n=1 Tax=Streptomyces sp. NPDC006711 TaxID=3364762 RepID=UPI0036933BBE
MRRTSLFRSATVAAVTLLTLLASSTGSEAESRVTTAAASMRSQNTLSCTLNTGPGERISFSPSVTSTPRSISARGSAQLNNCSSPNGRQSRIRSGQLTLRGTGRASCTRATGISGIGTITWYSGLHRGGRVVGRSTLKPAGHGSHGYTPLDSFLSGTIASGLMQGHPFTGVAVPTNDVRRCFGSGVGYVQGRGRLSVG